MDYLTIFEDFPQAIKMLKIWDKRVFLEEWPSRKMYDFFDAKMIEIGIWPLDVDFLKFKAKINVSTMAHVKLYCIDIERSSCSRPELECKVFQAAFKVLEQRIKSGDYD